MIVVADVDGTLVPRNGVLAINAARTIARLIDVGSQFAVITGQSSTDVARRVVQPLLAEGISGATVYTCEGACRWAVMLDGLHEDHAYGSGHAFSFEEQLRLESVVNRFLSWMYRRMGTQFSESVWWDNAMLVFKTRDASSPRMGLARAVRRFILRETRGRLPALRVGIAGATSTIVCRAGVDKGVAVRDVVRRSKPGEAVIYLGDEFAGSGNDFPVLRVHGITAISVALRPVVLPDGVVYLGGGPDMTLRFLDTLAETSLYEADARAVELAIKREAVAYAVRQA